MAEGIFNFLSEGAISRGIYAEGGCASTNAVRVMEKMGIDITGHKSKQLTREDVEEADLVFGMTKVHKNAVLAVMPEAEGKVFTLGEYAEGDDVSDPYGGSEAVYEATARQMYEYIERIVEKLK